MQLNNFMTAPNESGNKPGSYFPPPKGARPRALAPIPGGGVGRPPVPFPVGMEPSSSSRFRNKNSYMSTDQSASYIYEGGGRHKRGGSMVMPD